MMIKLSNQEILSSYQSQIITQGKFISLLLKNAFKRLPNATQDQEQKQVESFKTSNFNNKEYF